MKKKKIILLSLIVIIPLAFYGIHKYRSKSQMPGMKPVVVQAMTVKESMMPIEIRAIGTLTATSVEITSEEAGHVQNIYFKDGEAVKEQTVLLKLDDAVQQTKADLAKAKLGFSKTNYERTVFLGKKGIVAKQAIDQAEADYKEKAADAKESGVLLSKMQLRAPFAGRLGKCKVSKGDYLTVGQSIVTLTDTHHLHFEYNVPEKYLPLLKEAQPVNITTSTYQNKIFTGKVAFISPTINPENRSISIYADVDNTEGLLVPGMFANAKQTLGNKEKVILIPARSLVPVLEGEQVYKVINGKAFATSVLIGKRLKGDVQILQGLAAGDVVITDGQLKIRNGVPVSIKQ